MRQAQIKFGLALADDIRRLRKSNALPERLTPIRSSVRAVIKMGRRLRDRDLANGTSTKGLLTSESLKAWEDRLGPEKVQQAIALVESHGWRYWDSVPMWVWADAYRQVESGKPQYGTKDPGLDETILGFKI